MDLAEKIRARFRSEEFKVGLFGDVQSIYERAISLSVDAGDIEGAWQLSERARARALLDAVRGRVAAAIPRSGAPATPALGTRDLRSSLREGEVVLPERLLIWTLRQSEPKPRFVSVAVDRERLSLAIGTLHELMRQAETPSVTEIQAIGRELYGWLIAPADLREQERLIVIPHGNLHFLPFQALYDGQAYLIEKHPVASAASAALAAQSLLAAPRSSSGLVAFGNPLTSKEFHLEPLPGSEGEVARIGALFDSKAVYIGENATKQRFLSVSGSSGLLHLATHARLDLTDPLHSQIFLSPGPGHDDGALEAREIYALKLDGVALVTLSACDSGQGKVLRGDEMLGFTRSFLSAGASGLIASLWPVSDESTRQLMGLFYESLRQGNDVHRAMQSAQIGVLRTAEFSHPKRWAAFGLVGNWRMRTGG
jgi:CHAT domain-containing protein